MKRAACLCALLLMYSAAAPAAVYKWVDAKGKVEYGDQPPEGVHAELVELAVTHAAQSAPPGDRPGGGTPAAPTTAATTTAKDGAAQSVQDDVARTREKQCSDAQEQYRKLIEGRRLYKTGADGQREYLTSAEIDSERVSAKLDVDTACNGPA